MARRTQFIDQSTRTIETLVVFMITFFLLRPLLLPYAPSLGYLLCIVMPLGYLKLTVGKPDGYLLHLLYGWGLPLPGLLPPRLRRLRR